MAEHDTVARAFQLAKDGSCRSVNDIRLRLKREGYASYEAHLAGVSIKKQLNAIMKTGYAPGQRPGNTEFSVE